MNNMDHPERHLELSQLYQGKFLLLSKFTSSTMCLAHILRKATSSPITLSLYFSPSQVHLPRDDQHGHVDCADHEPGSKTCQRWQVSTFFCVGFVMRILGNQNISHPELLFSWLTRRRTSCTPGNIWPIGPDLVLHKKCFKMLIVKDLWRVLRRGFGRDEARR